MYPLCRRLPLPVGVLERVAYSIFWGTPSLPGSLCSLREVIRQVQVDKVVKVFNVGDEFLVHVFESHTF